MSEKTDIEVYDHAFMTEGKDKTPEERNHILREEGFKDVTLRCHKAGLKAVASHARATDPVKEELANAVTAAKKMLMPSMFGTPDTEVNRLMPIYNAALTAYENEKKQLLGEGKEEVRA